MLTELERLDEDCFSDNSNPYGLGNGADLSAMEYRSKRGVNDVGGEVLRGVNVLSDGPERSRNVDGMSCQSRSTFQNEGGKMSENDYNT